MLYSFHLIVIFMLNIVVFFYHIKINKVDARGKYMFWALLAPYICAGNKILYNIIANNILSTRKPLNIRL